MFDAFIVGQAGFNIGEEAFALLSVLQRRSRSVMAPGDALLCLRRVWEAEVASDHHRSVLSASCLTSAERLQRIARSRPNFHFMNCLKPSAWKSDVVDSGAACGIRWVGRGQKAVNRC